MMTLPLPLGACYNGYPLSEEIFPNIQPEPPLVELETLPPCSIASCQREKAYPHLATSSLASSGP